MIFRSIKWRLQLWHGVLLFLVLSGFGYTSFELQRTREFRRIDEELITRLGRVMPPVRPGPPGPLASGRGEGRGLPRAEDRRLRESRPADPLLGPAPGIDRPEGRPGPGRDFLENLPERRFPGFEPDSGFYFVAWRGERRFISSENAPAEVPRVRATPRPALRTRGEFREASQRHPRGEVYLVGRSISAEQAELKRLAFWLIAAGSGVLALGLAGGWFAASRAIAPIHNISATAQKIAAGDLSQRIPQNDQESELGRLTDILNSTFARLESAFAQQSRFTADVSHELRTPVTVILSQTQMALARERSAGEYRDAVQACERAALRMKGLIGALLQLARLDAGQEVVVQEPVDLAQIASETIDLLRPLAAAKEVQISCDCRDGTVIGDRGKLSQVITNLLTNAIQYNRPGGHVIVSCRTEGDSVLLHVDDTGPGIPPEDLEKIFNRFYRVDLSRAAHTGGTGLGLAIARAIVVAHSGALWAENRAGQGARFTLRLPKPRES